MVSTIPPEFRELADRLQDGLPQVLGADFVGLYVYGSLGDESFVAGRSDLDCMAITTRPLAETSFSRLAAWLADLAAANSRMSRLQMTLLVKERVLEDDPVACLYQFGVLQRCGSDGNPIIWLDFFQRGLTLDGPDPRSFVPPISPEILHEALVREVGYLRDEICRDAASEWRDRPSYRAYAVLTLCRILYTHANGRIAPKTTAAEWALDRLPDAFRELIQAADRMSRDRAIADLPLSAIARYIDYVGAEIARLS